MEFSGFDVPEAYLRDEPAGCIDEHNIGLLDWVPDDDFDAQTSPIISCAGSPEGDKMLEYSLGRMNLPTKPTELAYNPLRPATGGRKRKVEDLSMDSLDVDYIFFDDTKTADQSQSMSNGGDKDSDAVARKRQDHNSHTRKSREKLNDKFERLVDILPKANGADFELKHKAQILGHTLVTLERLLKENKVLEMEVALISRENVISWVEKVVSPAKNEVEAFQPFLELLCLKNGALVGELWKVNSTLPSLYTILQTAVPADLSEALRESSSQIQSMNIPIDAQEAILARHCFQSMRSCTGDQSCLEAAGRRWGVAIWSSLAVPIIYSGRVKLIAVLHSTKSEPDVSSILKTADLVATCLGNAYSSKMFREESRRRQEQKGGLSKTDVSGSQ